MNYFQHHIGDFNTATRHLSVFERGVYRELLDIYYDTEAPIPNDLQALCRRICCRRDGEPEIVQAVLDEFFRLDGEVWRHDRCDREIAKYHENLVKAKEGGKKSAESRKGKKPTVVAPPSNPPSTPLEVDLNPPSTGVEPPFNQPRTNNQEPRTINQEPNSYPAPNGAEALPRQSSPDFDDLPEGLSYHDALFQVAVPWLAANGVKESNARSLLGGAEKRLGAEGAWLLASECMEKKPLEPASWLAASLNQRIKRPKNTPYESEKDRSRREAYEQLTGRRGNEPITIDI